MTGDRVAMEYAHSPARGNGTEPVRVVVIDAAVVVRESLAEALFALPGIEVVGVFADTVEAVEAVGALAPDVVITDLRSPGTDGIHEIRQITSRHPNIAVLVSTASADVSFVEEALIAGARGCVLEQDGVPRLGEAIKALVQRQAPFSPELSGPLLDRLVGFLRREQATRLADRETSTALEELQHRTEEALGQVEAKFRALVEQVPAITYTEATDTQDTVFISPQVERILGYTPTEWMQTPHLWEQIIHPADRDRVVDECTTSNRNQQSFGTEYRMVARDGREIWFRDEAVLVRDENGTPVCWQGVMMDITERKRAEEALEALEAKFRTLVEQIPAIVYMAEIGEAGNWLYISPQIERVLGYSPDEWLAHPAPFSSHLHPEDKDRVLEEEAHRADCRESQTEYRMLTRDHQTVWIRDEAVIVRDDQGQPLFWQGLMIDITERKRADEALREAEARFRALVEQIPAVTYITAADEIGSVRYISPQVRQMTGHPPAEWEADDELWGRLIYPEDRDRVLAAYTQHVATGEPFSEEYRLITRQSRTVWVRDEATAVRDEQGVHLFSQGLMHDITELKRSEEERQNLLVMVESEWRLRETLKNVHLAAVGLDLAGRVTFCNDYLLRLTGWTREEVLGRDWLSVFVPPELEAAGQRFLQDMAVGSVRPHDEFPILTRSDRQRVVSWSNTLTRDARNHVIGAICIGQDVTDQRDAERRLRDAEARYRTLVEQIPAATYVDTADDALSGMKPLYVSPQIQSILGIPPEEFIGQDLWEERVHPDDRAQAVEQTMRGVASSEPFTLEYRMVRRDGRVVWIREQSAVLHDDDGRPSKVHGVFFDITDLKKGQEELEKALQMEREAAEGLRRADEMKNAFLTAVSHELRTPLTGILGNALLLEAHDELPVQDRRDLIHGLASKARTLNELVVDLLDVDGLARGVMEPRRRPTDVGALTRRMVERSNLVSERTVHVEVSETFLDVDAPMVERIVENLLVNAGRHTPAGSSVWVRVTREVDGVVIEVEDDGPGVPEELRELLFQPFQQGPGIPAHSPGVGIGLSLVARFAEIHGGRAWVEERPGGGASIRVFLPDVSGHGTP